jgi:hypothetical protein
MRILRLGLGDGRSIDLHPAVSVVTELTESQRTALRRSFTAIGAGLSPEPAALVEAHGLLLDATEDDLDLLDVATTAASTVATVADIPGAVPDVDAERLRTAEGDLVLLAAARAEWRRDLGGGRPTSLARPGLAERGTELRERIHRHEQRDAEGVRVALDRARDASRTRGAPDEADLVGALADVGLDSADLGLPATELVRMAEDWLDERAREAEWVVGAQVELQGIEAAAGPMAGATAAPGTDAALRVAHADAEVVVRTDELRSQLVTDHAPRPPLDELQEHLLARLERHRPDRLAGAVPLLIDGLLAHLDDDQVTQLLDRVAAAAGPVQLVFADQHPAAGTWAVAAGVHRAAVVTPALDHGATAPA